MRHLNILISHAYNEKELAEAWKKLIETISMEVIQVWFSSDTGPTGGVELGKPWLDDLYGRLDASDFVLAIQTPMSMSRAWIMWECGAASGINRERGVIPILYALGRGELANPLTIYQAYQGDDEAQVREVCQRLIQKAELKPPEFIYSESIKAYLASIRLHRRSIVTPEEQKRLWRDRIDELVQSGRVNELNALRQQMYTTLKKPVDIGIHERLSKLLLDMEDYQGAIQEADNALMLTADDIHLLHLKALALIGRKNWDEARKLVEEMISQNSDLSVNPEIAALLGRINRELWEHTHNTSYLEAATGAYYQAYLTDRTSYYMGINAAELAFTKGDEALGKQISQEVLATCQEFQKFPIVSFWVDFSAGEAYLGLGEIDKGIAAYQIGLNRKPASRERQRKSALDGALRMIEARKLPSEIVDRIKGVLL